LELRRHLTPDGVLVVNLASSGTGGDVGRAQAIVETMKRSFPVIEPYAVKGPWPSRSQAENLLFFAGGLIERDGTRDFADRIASLIEQQRLPSEAIALLKTRRTQPWPGGTVLTDDYAPYDLLMGTETPEERTRAVN
jgi:hypothetical protein